MLLRPYPVSSKTAARTYVCCVVAEGVVCTAKAYNLVVNRTGKANGLWILGHTACPQSANRCHVPEVSKVEATYDAALWYSSTGRPTQPATPFRTSFLTNPSRLFNLQHLLQVTSMMFSILFF